MSAVTNPTTPATRPTSPENAQRFYDRLRRLIHQYLQSKGRIVGTTGELLLLVPDVFMLLWRLVTDGRVNGKDKVLLGSGVAYYLFPLDIIPEMIVGPIGFMDDLIFGVYILNRMLTDTDPTILREHWSGTEDVLVAIQKVLNAADNLVTGDVLGRLKNMMK
jgi:uncharacterized membrane protein YkvA (DUF1232 family)